MKPSGLKSELTKRPLSEGHRLKERQMPLTVPECRAEMEMISCLKFHSGPLQQILNPIRGSHSFVLFTRSDSVEIRRPALKKIDISMHAGMTVESRNIIGALSRSCLLGLHLEIVPMRHPGETNQLERRPFGEVRCQIIKLKASQD